jgi:hypothetical protein
MEDMSHVCYIYTVSNQSLLLHSQPPKDHVVRFEFEFKCLQWRRTDGWREDSDEYVARHKIIMTKSKFFCRTTFVTFTEQLWTKEWCRPQATDHFWQTEAWYWEIEAVDWHAFGCVSRSQSHINIVRCFSTFYVAVPDCQFHRSLGLDLLVSS